MVRSPRGSASCPECRRVYYGFVGQTIECDCYRRCLSCGSLMVPFTQSPVSAFYQGELKILFECPSCHARSSRSAIMLVVG